MHVLRIGKGFCFHWKPRIFNTAFGDSRLSVLRASSTFTENTVLGIGRMPSSLMSKQKILVSRGDVFSS